MSAGHAGHGRSGGASSATGRSVTALVANPARPADVRYELTARKERFRLASGGQIDGYTVNGTSPGPVLRAVKGQLCWRI